MKPSFRHAPGPGLLALVGVALIATGITVLFVRRDPLGVGAVVGLITVGTRLVFASAFYSRVSGEFGARWKLRVRSRGR